MLHRDPAGTCSFHVRPGWAFDILSSTPTRLVFCRWSVPDDHSLFVRLGRTQAQGPDQAWVAKVRDNLPPEVTSVEVTAGPVPIVWVARPGREGRPDQRWAIVRGRYVDTTLEEVGVSLGGSMRTAALAAAVRTLHVPANGGPLAPKGGTWNQLMERAAEQAGRGDTDASARTLERARQRALAEWRESLVAGDPHPRLLVSAAYSLLLRASLTTALELLDDATVSLMQVRQVLEADDLATAERRLGQALHLHGEAAGELSPVDAFQAAFVRAKLSLQAVLRPPPSIAAEALLVAARLASRTAARCVVAAARVSRAPATDGLDSRQLFERRALALLVAADGAGNAIRTARGIGAELDLVADATLAARELARRDPQAASVGVLADALLTEADARLALRDGPSLDRAVELAREAREHSAGLLPEASRDLTARTWLLEAWAHQHAGRAQEALAAAEAVPEELARSRASVRANALLTLGRTAEAVAEARAANGPDDPAESAHRLTLANALLVDGQAGEALQEARLGLAAALQEYPFSATTLGLLTLLAELLDAQEAQPALRVTRLAQDLQDFQARMLPGAPEVAAFSEAALRRAVPAALVLRLLRAGDVDGALAAADAARARTLAPGWASRRLLTEEVVGVPPGGSSLEELLDRLAGALADAMRAAGLPEPMPGWRLRALVEESGRTTLLLHPTDEGLVRFLLRPGQPPVGEVVPVAAGSATALADELRRRLAGSLLAGAARGDLPTPEDLTVHADLQALVAAQEDPPDDDAEPDVAALLGVLGALLIPDGLTAGEPLALVPFRELATVPMGALVLKNGLPLAAVHPTSSMPSIAAVLGRPAGSGLGGRERPRAVVVGDPATDPGLALPPLSGARTEGRTVAAALGGQFAVVSMLGEQATEAAIRREVHGARLLHFAGHAAVRDPVEESALYVTAGPHDDGRLIVGEVADLPLDDALIVLAACETGLGRVTPDGVQGLGQALLRGGARSVVLSLWRVGDASTSHLMAAFYAALLGDRAPPVDVSRALARAQWDTRVGYPSVTQWAPWLVVGDGRWRVDG